MNLAVPRAMLLLTVAFAASSAHAQTTVNQLSTWKAEAQARPQAPLLSRAALQLRDVMPVSSMTFAPDGSKASYLIAEGPTRRLILEDSQTGAVRTLLTSDRLQQVQWTADSKGLLLTMKGLIAVFPLAADGDARYLYKLDTRRKQLMVGVTSSLSPQLLIASTLDNKSQLTLVDGTGLERTLYEGEGVIERAVADADAHHLFLQVVDGSAKQIVAVEARGVRSLLRCPVYEKCELDEYDSSSGRLWIRQNRDSDLLSLYSLDVTSGQIRLEAQDPAGLSDIREVCYASNKPQIVHYEDRSLRAVALHGRDARLLTFLQRSAFGSNFAVTACGANRWLVREEGSNLQQLRYHLFDKSTQRATRLSGSSAVVDPRHFTIKHFVQYRASDGMLLNGYLSLPSGVPLSQAPLVAIIHGGPNARVSLRYDERVQLLTNRGYVVFEPNFRASTGFGQRYVRAANKEFGNGRVQQDILDGLDWLLANGIGDRSQQAVVGSSFGGFGVLTALAYTPKRFVVGVAMVPPPDLGATIRQIFESPSPDPAELAHLRQFVLDAGNPAEVEALYRRSPMAALSSIEAPLLIVAGGADDRVDIRYVRKFVSRLLMERKPLSLLIDEREGHGFAGEDARTAQLFLLESFLANSLRGRMEPLNEDTLPKYLQRNLLVNQTPGFVPTR